MNEVGKTSESIEEERSHVPLLKQLGPGFITGAADDDPSGIATYSQAGAQYGYGLVWSVLFTTPLMIGIQLVSARIGRVTGHGLAANIRERFPRPVLYTIVCLLAFANTFNIAADLGAMADALVLVAGGNSTLYIVMFALTSLTLQIFVPFPRYAPILKLLTLALFAYVATVFLVHMPLAALGQTLMPRSSTTGTTSRCWSPCLGRPSAPTFSSGRRRRRWRSSAARPAISRCARRRSRRAGTCGASRSTPTSA